jgi:hypothetical protein
MRDVKFSWGCIGAGSAILLFIAALANNVRHDTNMAGAADAVENNCLATTDHTCASRTNLAANKSCLVCVYQPCDRFRLKACAPIEPLKLKEWRHDARKGLDIGVAARDFSLTGGATDCEEIIFFFHHAESSRHRRDDACSMAWRCRFLTARQSQHGRIMAEK